MPRIEVTRVTVSHIWDDDSRSDYEINKGIFDCSGPYVSVQDGGQTIYLRPESWPRIRDQVQAMFDSFSDGDTEA